jgi:hypothetical protein
MRARDSKLARYFKVITKGALRGLCTSPLRIPSSTTGLVKRKRGQGRGVVAR